MSGARTELNKFIISSIQTVAVQNFPRQGRKTKRVIYHADAGMVHEQRRTFCLEFR